MLAAINRKVSFDGYLSRNLHFVIWKCWTPSIVEVHISDPTSLDRHSLRSWPLLPLLLFTASLSALLIRESQHLIKSFYDFHYPRSSLVTTTPLVSNTAITPLTDTTNTRTTLKAFAMSGMSSSEDEAAVASPETRPSLSSDQTVSITASSSVDISDGAEPAQPKEPIAKLSGKYIDVNTVRAAGGSLAMAVLILPAEYKIVAKAKASAISVSELSPEDRMYEQKVSGYKKRKGIDEGVSESDAMRVIDFDYIPRSLSRGGMPALTPMIEAQLWLRGFLCNM